ncbi:MAG: hypothetical protein EPO23_10335 [Xanthobacteraceae bacterium]|nr:MAG: hypothetical protein EPO23_10335 [Xanthobacteraceae bacterium]
MSAIMTILRPVPGRHRQPGPPEHKAAAAPAGDSRALTVTEPPRPATPPPSSSPRPQAAFVTQLIAVAQQWPQTRARCRAEPQAAAALYRDALSRIANDGRAAGLSRVG